MEKENKKNGVIAFLLVIIIILLILIGLFVTGNISFKPDKNTDNNSNNNQNNNVITNDSIEDNNEDSDDYYLDDDSDYDNSSNIETINDKVDIDLSINNVTISPDGPNEKLHIYGTIDLSYNSSIYEGVTISGYCLGVNNEKYIIFGPVDGRALFHNDGNSSMTLAENTSKDIEYYDGSFKGWSDVDWYNVKIKYCKINKMTAILNEGTNNPEKVLSFEKSF